MRKFAWFLIISSVIASVAEMLKLKFPTISWAFNLAHEKAGLHSVMGAGEDAWRLAWFGYFVAVLGIVAGLLILSKHQEGGMLPTTKRRIERFRANRRGLISLYIISFFVLLASLDQVLVGKRALYASYNGESYFPAFMRKDVAGEDFGLTGDLEKQSVNYRDLKKRIAKNKEEGTVIMPLVPYDPTEDTVDVPVVPLEEKDGKLLDTSGEPLDGRAMTLYGDSAESIHMSYVYRQGVKAGLVTGKTEEGVKVYEARYKDNVLVPESEKYSGEGMSKEEFLKSGNDVLSYIHYHSAPPMPSQGHMLGTTIQGYDLLAYLYGGLQLNIKAAVLYIPAIYIIGVSIGLLMGYFGGTFDLILQRIIEIFSTIPFLFVVIILSSLIKPENRGLYMILAILIAFGWMGMTYLMRTAALKEKARDYVAAARVSGASTSRVLFSHILPNTVAILVTLVPFSISGIIMSLTALDYLGFGLPGKYATWGTLLKDGLANYSKPWLVASAFTVLVSTLILVTFVGEAIRDAFDPKKFSTYK